MFDNNCRKRVERHKRGLFRWCFYLLNLLFHIDKGIIFSALGDYMKQIKSNLQVALSVFFVRSVVKTYSPLSIPSR